jgi:uncharacterized protein YdbL (DUF1318 family)
MTAVRTFLLAGSLLLGSPAAAQSAIGEALQAGQVGERYDGYMAVVGPATPQLQRQVAAINLRRRNLYIGLAGRRNVNPQVVGLATACELFAKLAVGEAYLLDDGAWRRRAPGQAAPVPNSCR